MICKVENCKREVRYTGLCGMHYKRQWRHGNVHYTERTDNPQCLQKCSVEECNNMIGEHGAKGYCSAHYNRWYKYNRLHRVIAPQGDGTIDSNGYRVYCVNGEKIYEHRYLAASALGRSLPKGVVVHHMNGIKDDNYTDMNLVICPDQSYHMLLEYRTYLQKRGLLKCE